MTYINWAFKLLEPREILVKMPVVYWRSPASVQNMRVVDNSMITIPILAPVSIIAVPGESGRGNAAPKAQIEIVE